MCHSNHLHDAQALKQELSSLNHVPKPYNHVHAHKSVFTNASHPANAKTISSADTNGPVPPSIQVAGMQKWVEAAPFSLVTVTAIMHDIAFRNCTPLKTTTD
jgi:hypothetical protein